MSFAFDNSSTGQEWRWPLNSSVTAASALVTFVVALRSFALVDMPPEPPGERFVPDDAERAAEASVGHDHGVNAVSWEELDGIERASHFAIRDVETLLKRAKSARLSGWGLADQALPALGQVWNSRRG